MSHRFYSPESIQNDQVTLVEDQAHHLINVMRFKTGDQITVFDGSGWQAKAEIIQTSRREVQLQVLEREQVSRELETNLTLAVALPKGDRQKFLIEKLVEVGVSRLIPITTQRSVAQPNAKAVQRLIKNVIAASKQCERNSLMEITEPVAFDKLIRSSDYDSHQKLIATTHGQSVAIGSVHSKSSVIAMIGPEGGFTLEENESANQAGYQAIRLGPSILRLETAAIAIAAILGIGTHGKSSLN